jgi:SAM-dependent methyltransferase
MSARDAKAWGDFWAQNQQGGGGGCLPSGWERIDGAQRAVWSGFAKRLPQGARLLDLATGDGRVMEWLLKARRDLKPVGVDLAPELPDPPRGTKVRAGVAMEHLPFPDGRFDAATSQFGFEYGDIDAAAGEIARVLRPGGLAGLMSHRGDGPILEHNLRRREAIRWALEERDLVATAKRSLQLGMGIGAGPPPLIAAAPAEGARRFGQGSAAWEIAEAVRRTLVLGARDHPANVARVLDTIAARAANELGRIASLEAACGQADDVVRITAAFASAGLEQLEQSEVAEQGSTRPFATFRLLRRG